MAMNFGDEKLAFSNITRDICTNIHSGHMDNQKLNTFLDELNSLDYKNSLFVSIDDASSLISALTVHIKPIDSFSAAKAAHLIFSLIGKQRLSFRTNCLQHTLTWTIKCITECADIVLADILQTLHIILQSHPQQTTEHHGELLGENGILLSLIENYGITPAKQVLSSANLQYEAILTSLKCLQTLTLQGDGLKSTEEVSSSLDQDDLQRVSDVVIKYLYIGIQKDQDEFNYCKCVLYGLRILSQIYMCNNMLERRLHDTVGLGRSFMTFGLDNQLLTLQRITPSQQVVAEPSSQNAKGGKKQKVRKQRNAAVDGLKKDIPLSDRSLLKEIDIKDNARTYTPVNQCSFVNRVNEFQMSSWPATSDSDASDNENSRDAKLKVLKARVRQGAMNLLLVLIKMTDRRDMFGYWWALLPTCHDADNWEKEEGSRRTLPYVAMADPSAAGRAAALGAVLALLTGSRLYLAQAEISKRTITAFTPFSVTLGHAVSCLHVVLCGVLESERVSSVWVAALKVSAALLQATPYHRLQDGLLPPLVKVARKYLVHRNVTVQVAALIVIGCVLSIDPVVDDVLKSIAKDEIESIHCKVREAGDNKDVEDDEDGFEFEEGYSDDEMFTTQKSDTEQDEDLTNIVIGNTDKIPKFKTWILDICIKNLGWITKDEKFVKCHAANVHICLESLQVLSALAFHHFPLLQNHLVSLTEVLTETLDSDHDEVVLQTLKCVSSIGDAVQKLEQNQQVLPPLSDCVGLWSGLLRGPLTALLQAPGNPAGKAVACDCVANIGERAFRELERNLQVLCVTLLFGSCTDEDPLVRAAAVRALAMCVTYQTLREDICFVSDCGESILRVLKEPTQAVRVKAAWSLGNLSDVLTLNMTDPDLDSIDDDLLLRLLETSIVCSTENDKIKMNSTRAIGNLLRLVTKKQLGSNARFKALSEKALERLLECACKVSNMKIRWNACYAIGNTLKSEVLYASVNEWQKKVFSSLCGLALDCRNLKVRINATVALRCPTSRQHYSQHLPLVWSGVMAAMDNATNVDDFTEFKHKDNLIEQLCVTLSHLCCLLDVSDLPELMESLVVHGSCARGLFLSLGARLPPQHLAGARVLDALRYCSTQLTPQSDTQRQALGLLREIFVWET